MALLRGTKLSQRAVNKQTDWTGRSQLQSLRAVVRQKNLVLKARAGASLEEKMATLGKPARVQVGRAPPIMDLPGSSCLRFTGVWPDSETCLFSVYILSDVDLAFVGCFLLVL